MYRNIDNTVIPDQHFKTLADMHVRTQNIRVLNIGGKSKELRKVMELYNYYEPGDSDDLEGLFQDLNYLSDIPERSTVLLIDPSIELISDMKFVRKLDEMPVGCFLIVVLQDVNLPGKEIPYGDESLPFQSRLRKRFVLRDNKRLRYSRARFQEGISHTYHAFVLERADVQTNNNLTKKKFDHNNSWEAQHPDIWKTRTDERITAKKRYVNTFRDSGGKMHSIGTYERVYIPSVKDPFYQHPVKSVRRMPLIVKPGTFDAPPRIKLDEQIYGNISPIKNEIKRNQEVNEGSTISIGAEYSKPLDRR